MSKILRLLSLVYIFLEAAPTHYVPFILLQVSHPAHIGFINHIGLELPFHFSKSLMVNLNIVSFPSRSQYRFSYLLQMFLSRDCFTSFIQSAKLNQNRNEVLHSISSEIGKNGRLVPSFVIWLRKSTQKSTARDGQCHICANFLAYLSFT